MLFLSFFSDYFQRYAKNDDQRFSAYECGFLAFDDARVRFDVRYYLVAILFLVFDIELVFLFPWTVNFSFVEGGF
jgi:NADH-quinone oxidoreductase subunit A